MNFLTNLDNSILFAVNNSIHTPLLDQFFLLFAHNPVVVWVLIGVLVLVIQRRKDAHFLLDLVAALFIAGFLGSVLLKPLISRPRPDITHGAKVVVVAESPAAFAMGNDYAFPSGHATVAFAGAFILMRRKKNWKVAFYAIAFLTAFSRMYLGKHYLSDVIAGGFLGTVVSYVIVRYVEVQGEGSFSLRSVLGKVLRKGS